eukprot:32065-Chlamydomonas_euryale.AAC.1
METLGPSSHDGSTDGSHGGGVTVQFGSVSGSHEGGTGSTQSGSTSGSHGGGGGGCGPHATGPYMSSHPNDVHTADVVLGAIPTHSHTSVPGSIDELARLGVLRARVARHVVLGRHVVDKEVARGGGRRRRDARRLTVNDAKLTAQQVIAAARRRAGVTRRAHHDGDRVVVLEARVPGELRLEAHCVVHDWPRHGVVRIELLCRRSHNGAAATALLGHQRRVDNNGANRCHWIAQRLGAVLDDALTTHTHTRAHARTR